VWVCRGGIVRVCYLQGAELVKLCASSLHLNSIVVYSTDNVYVFWFCPGKPATEKVDSSMSSRSGGVPAVKDGAQLQLEHNKMLASNRQSRACKQVSPPETKKQRLFIAAKAFLLNEHPPTSDVLISTKFPRRASHVCYLTAGARMHTWHC